MPSFSQSRSLDDFLDVSSTPKDKGVFRYNPVDGQTKEGDVTAHFQAWDDKHHDDTYGKAKVTTVNGKALKGPYQEKDLVYVVAPVRRAKKPTERHEFAYENPSPKDIGAHVLTYKVRAGENEPEVRTRFDKWKGEHKQPYKSMVKGNGRITDAKGKTVKTFVSGQEVYVTVEKTVGYHATQTLRAIF